MKYTKENMVGREIQLFPGDSINKFGVIEDINEYGWFIRSTNNNDLYKNNEIVCFPFSHHTFHFKFVDNQNKSLEGGNVK